ncbi:MAG: glutamate 5-kinase [Candidatus Micrarchaeia archaeon]|jgi:glutamate 5-kinase
MNFSPQHFKRIVVKAGTNVLTTGNGQLDAQAMAQIAGDIASLHSQGKQLVLVTSGAIGCGMSLLGLKQRPREVAMQQACAAVGQGALMHAYQQHFSKHSIKIAQVLLTSDDFSEKARYLNLMHTLDTLLKMRTIPIINENDVVSTCELAHEQKGNKPVVFSDNDWLSALVASKMHADLLVLLTDVDGFYDQHPKAGNAKLIRTVERITPEMEEAAGKGSALGRGGMRGKLGAAQLATKAGVWVAIANGKKKNILASVLSQSEGTLFKPSSRLSGKEQWIAFASAPKGTVSINECARKVLLSNGASLLAVGVVSVSGTFSKGDVVEVKCGHSLLGRGKSNYSSSQLSSIAGKKKEAIVKQLGKAEEVIDRENLVLTQTGE